MPEDWLDGLSEEWPSQPPSEASFAQSTRSSMSRSRIPQPQSSATHPSVRSKRPSEPRRRSVLSERSTNVQSPSATRSSDKPTRSSLVRSTASTSSATSVVQVGTTQVRKSASASPPKDGHETPEWKRRLLQGKGVGYEEQVDLFSPMGLEKMFARPSVGTANAASKKTRRMSALNSKSIELPSSPPVFNLTRENTIAEILQGSSELEPVEEVLFDQGEEQHQSTPGRVEELQQSHFLEQPKSEQDTKLSDRSASDSSGFSPVFISKHQDAKGSIKYAALDLSKNEVQEQIERHRESLQASVQDQRHAPPEVHVEDQPSETSYSLPDDLPTGTPDALPLTDFVNVRRGGLSAEGSFRRRPLSPSPLKRELTDDGDELIQQSSALLGDEEATIEPTEGELRPPAPTPPATRTPTHIRQATADNTTLNPWKLFGDHDTYTTNRLVRRMSQLELQDQPATAEPQVADGSILLGEAHTQTGRFRGKSSRPSQGSRTSFGSGQLDDYAFAQVEVAEPESDPNQEDEEDDGVQLRSRSPSPSQLPPGAKEPLRFRVGSGSSDVYDTFKHKRKSSKWSNRSGSLTVSKRQSANSTQRSNKPEETRKLAVETGSVSHVSEGKRPLTPFYDPTPKRRRTLVFAEEIEEIPTRAIMSTQESHERLQQSVSGRKRKDARHSNVSNQADADTLAKRHILRPRNPTPSQRRQEQIEKEILEVTQDYLASSPRLHSIREHLRPPAISLNDEDPESSRLMAEEQQALAVAEEVAAFSIRVAKDLRKDESRKRSVTTQDFLDEAMKIMDFIRTKRPTSALSSLEESDEDKLDDADAFDQHVQQLAGQDDEADERDLVSELLSSPQIQQNGWRQRDVANLNSSMVNHLRQFEDNSDPFVASSWSLHNGHKDNVPLTPVHEDMPESDPPGLRIIENPELQSVRAHSRKNSKDEHPSKSSSTGRSIPSHKSHPSVASTTMTSASRKSDKVATIAPSNVAHLLGKEVNGMYYDDEKRIWVRRKSLSQAKEDIEHDLSGMEGSGSDASEDPFGEIPDLTVDEEKEIERCSPSRPVTATSAQRAARQLSMSQVGASGQLAQAHKGKLETQSTQQEASDDHSKSAAHAEPSSPTLRKQPPQGHTSKAINPKEKPFMGPESPVSLIEAGAIDAVDHEYSLDERRSSPPKPQSARRVSHIQISISSPAMPQQQRADPESLRRKPSALYKTRDLPPLPPQIRQATTQDTAKRRAKQALEPVSEHHEVSIIDYGADDRRVNFSVSLSAPLMISKQEEQALTKAPSSPLRVDATYATFLMSELDDFSFHQPDELEQPTRQLVKKVSGDVVKVEETRFENGNGALVRALQDVEPQEPFWEELRQVVLPKRDLTSLHLLDSLCENVVEVDVSGNNIAQLVGLPSSTRYLDVSNNLLTGLTAWHHLLNLQYLDISGNDIDSLQGLAALVHLRGLRCDDNRIDSLNGVAHLDGLLSLSAKRNRIQTVNVQGCGLVRLESLDLEGNQLGDGDGLQSLHALSSLRELNLDANGFEDWDPSYQQPCRSIETLSLRGNRLIDMKLDANQWPALRHLHLDDNRLCAFSNIWTLALDTFTARRQVPPLGQSMNARVLHDLPQTRAIALSGSHIPTLSMPSDGLPYLTHLELADCGLQHLPSDFGRQLPSLISLNANGNNINDVSALLGCKSLTKLLLANNRLSRLRKVVAVLERISGRLTMLDLRGNAVTQGFYEPQSLALAKRRESDGGGQLVRTDSPTERLEKSKNTSRLSGVRSPGLSSKLTLPWNSRSSSTFHPFSADAERYQLPDQDADADARHKERLDNDTAMRRRVYEIMMSSAVPNLQILDGLVFDIEQVRRRDGLWVRLEKLGVVKAKGET